jgi:hypothetical protein
VFSQGGDGCSMYIAIWPPLKLHISVSAHSSRMNIRRSTKRQASTNFSPHFLNFYLFAAPIILVDFPTKSVWWCSLFLLICLLPISKSLAGALANSQCVKMRQKLYTSNIGSIFFWAIIGAANIKHFFSHYQYFCHFSPLLAQITSFLRIRRFFYVHSTITLVQDG